MQLTLTVTITFKLDTTTPGPWLRDVWWFEQLSVAHVLNSWKEGSQSVWNLNLSFLSVHSQLHNSYFLPWIMKAGVRRCLPFLRWPRLLCAFCWAFFWDNWNLVHLLDVKIFKTSKHVPFLCSTFLYYKTLPEHYHVGPLDLMFFTPMKP